MEEEGLQVAKTREVVMTTNTMMAEAGEVAAEAEKAGQEVTIVRRKVLEAENMKNMVIMAMTMRKAVIMMSKSVATAMRTQMIPCLSLFP